ncbi:MAG: HAMP domain-containing sensor histidine kinase [Arcobacteraceae bacterium]|nr:HAMP domain-containing sensor histidine kinase [Arcobacteraceae bacterium]
MFAILIVIEEYRSYDKEIKKIEQEYLGDKKASTLIAQKTHEHKTRITRYIIGIGGVTLFMFFTVFGVLRLVAFLIEYEFRTFIKEFANSAINHTKIDKNKFNFEESKKMITSANILVQEIINREKELKELNLGLEDKIRIKTLKLQNTLKAQDEFIKKSIHEINTPLSIILTNIDLLKMQRLGNKNLTNIESASKIIHNIYDDLSYMVKKDRINYPKKLINFSSFLFQRIEFFDEIALANTHEFVVNIRQDLYIDFNDIELQRVIDNKLSNAIKYSYKDKPIFIKLEIVDQRIKFAITTNSNKIENIDLLCQDFYREDSVKGGFGLGLKIVKDICDKNNVIMEVSSSSKETKFIYRFDHENIIA